MGREGGRRIGQRELVRFSSYINVSTIPYPKPAGDLNHFLHFMPGDYLKKLPNLAKKLI